MNPNCRQLIFMNYLRKKCQYDKAAFIDLLDENGKIANIHMVEPQDNVADNFDDRLIYIPVMIEKASGEDNTLKMVKPLLEDWEKKFPQLERKIKILTGELKRKISPTTKGMLEPRGRSVDRKRSSSNKDDISGRSTSNMSRHSSISQSGRQSTTNAGKPTVSSSGRKSIVGKSALDGGKGVGGKAKGKRK